MTGFAQLCGILAPIASVLVCLSPLPTVHLIVKNRQVGNLPLLPYSTMVVNSTLWFAYGLLKHNPSIWSCNGIGLVLGFYYLYQYVPFAPVASPTLPGTLRSHLLAVAGVMTTTILLAILPIVNDPAWIIGKVGLIICVTLFASPLTVLRHVLATKSARSIPLPFTIASTVNCFLWSIFGLWQVNDTNVYIPNILGLAFSLVQLGLKIHFDDNLMQEFSSGYQSKTSEGLPLSSPPSSLNAS